MVSSINKVLLMNFEGTAVLSAKAVTERTNIVIMHKQILRIVISPKKLCKALYATRKQSAIANCSEKMLVCLTYN